MEDFKLIAVKCKSCDSGLTVEMNDNIVYCSSCGNGWEIVNEELIPVEIGFAKPLIQGQGELVYKGFWLVDTYVKIHSRDSSGGWISSLFGGANKTEGDVLFYVPAFWMPIESVKQIGVTFTTKNAVPSPEKYNVKLTGFNFTKEDAKKIAEFIFLSIEAEKSDMVRNINYDLKVKGYKVLGVPFYKQPNGRLKDAITGIEIA
jgi:hypothetical protein